MISGPDKDRSTCRSHLCAYPARAVGAVAGWRAEGEAVWTTGDADLKLSRHESLSEFRLRFLPTGVCWWSALHRCPWREPCRWPPGVRIDNETWALAKVALARTCLAACYLVQLPSTKKWGRAASLANGTVSKERRPGALGLVGVGFVGSPFGRVSDGTYTQYMHPVGEHTRSL